MREFTRRFLAYKSGFQFRCVRKVCYKIQSEDGKIGKGCNSISLAQALVAIDHIRGRIAVCDEHDGAKT